MQQLATKANAFLRFVRSDTYRSGDRYRDFELLVDVPEVPVTDSEAPPPLHAAAGDILRENGTERRLTPFDLRRDGVEIGNPEWWMVRHLFEGILGDGVTPAPSRRPSLLRPATLALGKDNAGPEVEGYYFRRAPDGQPPFVDVKAAKGDFLYHDTGRSFNWHLFAWNGSKSALTPVTVHAGWVYQCVHEDKLDKDPRFDAPRARVRSLPTNVAVALLERPREDMRPGDLIVMGEEGAAALGGSVAPLSRDHQEALRAALDADKNVLTELRPFAGGPWGHSAVVGFLEDRRRWGRKSPARTKLWRVRLACPSSVSRPIEATSDDGALFELLIQCGGRMPAKA